MNITCNVCDLVSQSAEHLEVHLGIKGFAQMIVFKTVEVTV